MTGSSSSSSPTSTPKPAVLPRAAPQLRAGQPLPAAAAGFQQAQQLVGQKRAFADALSAAKGATAKLLKDDKSDVASLGMASPRELFVAPAAVQQSPPGDVDPALQAHLERIAAAIAEVAKAGEPQIQLDLPLGAYRIESAVLGRDAAGALNIALVPASAVPPTVAAQWAEQLQERLLRRDVRTARIGVQGATARRVVSAA